MAPLLKRLTLGRLRACSTTLTDGVTERFRTEEWDPATNISVSLSGGNLRFSAGSAQTRRFNRFTGHPEAIRADMFVQCVWVAKSTGGGGGPICRSDDQAVPGAGVALQVPSGFSGTETTVEYDASAAVVQQDADAGRDRVLPERLSLYTVGTEAKSYNHDSTEEKTLSGLTVASGAAALYYSSGGAANAIDYSQFYLMRSHLVRVVGPSTGNWRARVKNGAGTVLAFADHSAGVAEVDLFAARVNFPDPTRIEIYDNDTATVLVSFDPHTRIWGGDEWIYREDETDPEEVPEFEMTAEASGKLAAFDDGGAVAPYDAFDTADWTAPANVTLSIVSGRLRLQSSASNIFQRVASLTALGSREDVFIQAAVANVGGTGCQAGPVARASGTHTTNEGIYADQSYSDGFGTRLLERDSADIQSELLSGVNLSPGPTRHSLVVRGAIAQAFNYGAFVYQDLAGIALTGAGAVGVELNRGSAGVVDYSQVLFMTDSRITVTGPSGRNWRAAIFDVNGDQLAYADAVAGVATIDAMLFRVRFPQVTRLEILDTDEPDYPLLAAIEPAGLIWGGDEYDWDPLVETSGALAFGATFTASPEVENPEPEYRPCTAVLEVYEDDGETIAFTVTTDPASDHAYLMPPDNYGAREIDPVSGAASIGTVDVQIVDPAQIPGDQDGGWMTERLDQIFGRRCRLRRYVSQLEGFYTIADGPAGAPRMSADYASFAFSIRDTREGERRLRPFSTGGATALVPFGPIEDWGEDPDSPGSPLLAAVTPLIGRSLVQFNSTAGEYVGQILLNDYFDFVSTPGTVQMDPLVELSDDAIAALKGVNFGERSGYPSADVLWRIAGSGDPWNVARPSPPALYAALNLGGIQTGVREGTSLAKSGLLSLLVYWNATELAGFPTESENDTEIEVILRHRGAPSDEIPYYFDGTLGALLTALYDRTLETGPTFGGDVHDPLGFDDVPSSFFGGGVRVDAAALAAIDTPVLLRQTEAVDDGRAWAESNLYAPSGWIPSLDAEGRISPVSRARPDTIDGPLIEDDNTEPSPDWNAGERVVTVIRYNYLRYFVPPAFPVLETGTDGLAVREVTVEYRDPAAIDRHGEQVEEFDATAFGAIGNSSGQAIDGEPEVADILASAARYEVLERYRDGAQAIVVNVRRSTVPGLRDGTFLPVQLSWLPNFGTGRRGMNLTAAQVLSLENLNCEWIGLLIEEVPVAAAPGYYTLLDKIEDTPDPGYYDELEVIDDVEGGS
jgi:hypothetical protein